MSAKNELKRYLSWNYPIELVRDAEQGGFFATHPDLPGCAAQGETAEEAISALDSARELWIETRLEDGLAIPMPLTEEPSGKILVRLPRSVHAELAKTAARQGVSLNLLINTVLAEYVGGERCSRSVAELDQLVEKLNEAVRVTSRGPRSDVLNALQGLSTGYVLDNPDPDAAREALVTSTFSTVVGKQFLGWQIGGMPQRQERTKK